MRNGQISNTAKEYSKKKILYLLLIWGTLLISGGIILTLTLLDVYGLYVSIVIFFLVIVIFIMLFYTKSRISYYDLQQRYQLLLDNSVGKEKTKCLFDNDWYKRILASGYKIFVDNNDFAILYMIRKSLAKKTFIRTNYIEIISIIRNNHLDFYSDVIENKFKELWMTTEKENHLNKQVIIHFKKYNSFSAEIKNDLDRIIAFREGDNYLVNVNCGFFTDDQSIYYLHADKYYPNIYYKVAVDQIKFLTNN